jgi:hypothetical protein
MKLTSLPDRPLSRSEFESLKSADSVADAVQFAGHGGPDGERVLQFVLDLDGEYVALHFDPDAGQWETLQRSDSFEDVTMALQAGRGL